MDDAVLYIKIYFAGAIASMLYNMGAGILRAMGDSRKPTMFLMAACGSTSCWTSCAWWC